MQYQDQITVGQPINSQLQSRLFGVLPKEIRDIIYSYALTAYEELETPYERNERYCRPGTEAPHRVAVELLLTCRAILVEAYKLPFLLNPIIAYGGFDCEIPPGQYRRLRVSRWMYNLFQSAEISLQQFALEALDFNEIRGILNRRFQIQEGMQSTNGSLDISTTVRPIKKLTLRMNRTDWWTWTSDPGHIIERLALDPGWGDGTYERRATPEIMFREAERRRKCKSFYFGTSHGWGREICKFTNLETLELIFETFSAKKAQIDAVIECAKTWAFPLNDTHALSWDGKIEAYSWTGAGPYWYNDNTTSWKNADGHSFEARTVRWRLQRIQG